MPSSYREQLRQSPVSRAIFFLGLGLSESQTSDYIRQSHPGLSAQEIADVYSAAQRAQRAGEIMSSRPSHQGVADPNIPIDPYQGSRYLYQLRVTWDAGTDEERHRVVLIPSDSRLVVHQLESILDEYIQQGSMDTGPGGGGPGQGREPSYYQVFAVTRKE